ncbi:hypothetical protein BHM03_00019865, partial [Ensete ventricosum]
PVCARPPASQSLRRRAELVRMSGDSGVGSGILMLEWRSPDEEGIVLLGSFYSGCCGLFVPDDLTAFMTHHAAAPLAMPAVLVLGEMASSARPNSSNEIHDIDVVTAQNSYISPSLLHQKSLKEVFPPFLARKVLCRSTTVVAEMIATFLLVFVTCGSAALSKSNPAVVSQLGASVAGGLIVTVMIYAVGHISGAHMNPAVTLAFAVARHFPWIQVR